jgi:mannose/fructose/N-acetylgalactosamine-specific phosphotransferase system component IIC
MNDPMSAAPVKAHRGTMLLIFGILGIICCIIFAILAWVMGSSDLKAMADGTMDSSGEGLTKAGKILGMIGCALGILSILWVVFFGGLAALSAMGGR